MNYGKTQHGDRWHMLHPATDKPLCMPNYEGCLGLVITPISETPWNRYPFMGRVCSACDKALRAKGREMRISSKSSPDDPSEYKPRKKERFI